MKEREQFLTALVQEHVYHDTWRYVVREEGVTITLACEQNNTSMVVTAVPIPMAVIRRIASGDVLTVAADSSDPSTWKLDERA